MSSRNRHSQELRE